jgi:UDP-N-acetylmuramoyl-tripeptide--D-alanyl-D-alanine ligase
VLARGGEGGPSGATIDSRAVGAGELFVGLPGERADGGQFARDALAAGAWGALIGRQWGRELAAQRERLGESGGWVLGAEDPLGALQRLAREWRRELRCKVVGITGSTGKTSVKDICRAILPVETHASPENYNTEVGLPLAILGAEAGTEALVLEMGMRGTSQIAELCRIAEPDVGLITNVGPVHVELLGSIEAIAAAKAELLAGITEGGAAVVPAEAGALAPHLDGSAAPGPASGVRVICFGASGDVYASEVSAGREETVALIQTPAGAQQFRLPFVEAYNLTNALAAVAVGLALGLPLERMAQRAPGIVFSRLRGEIVELPGGAILINDCYNANPVSMHAALDHLGRVPAEGRRLAVLGEMRELGPDAAEYHRQAGRHAREVGVELLIGVGELGRAYEPDRAVPDAEAAAEALAAELREGDAVLVKGSRAVGLERVAERLQAGGKTEPSPEPEASAPPLGVDDSRRARRSRGDGV